MRKIRFMLIGVTSFFIAYSLFDYINDGTINWVQNFFTSVGIVVFAKFFSWLWGFDKKTKNTVENKEQTE